MGLGGISIWQLLIVLLIVVLIFGTKKLKNMGGDLGGAVKNFKDSMAEGKDEAEQEVEDASLAQKDKLENKASEILDEASADEGSVEKTGDNSKSSS